MKTYALCPISDKKINESVARLNATFTVVFLIFFLLTSNVYIVAFLLVDFFLRSAELSSFSPIAIASKYFVNVLKIKAKPVNAGPKIFAARIGVVFNIAVLLSAISGLNALTLTFTTVFGVCAFLEASIGFCVACQIYPFVYKLFYDTKLVSQK